MIRYAVYREAAAWCASAGENPFDISANPTTCAPTPAAAIEALLASREFKIWLAACRRPMPRPEDFEVLRWHGSVLESRPFRSA